MTSTARSSSQPLAAADRPQHSGRIVVGVDGSQGSLNALLWALGEARARKIPDPRLLGPRLAVPSKLGRPPESVSGYDLMVVGSHGHGGFVGGDARLRQPPRRVPRGQGAGDGAGASSSTDTNGRRPNHNKEEPRVRPQNIRHPGARAGGVLNQKGRSQPTPVAVARCGDQHVGGGCCASSRSIP